MHICIMVGNIYPEEYHLMNFDASNFLGVSHRFPAKGSVKSIYRESFSDYFLIHGAGTILISGVTPN